jgi:uncharacterized protein
VKFLVVALVVGVVVWLLVHGRRRERPARRPAAREATQPMVVCAHCGVHLPRAEAVTDARGSFCSEAHRLAGPA